MQHLRLSILNLNLLEFGLRSKIEKSIHFSLRISIWASYHRSLFISHWLVKRKIHRFVSFDSRPLLLYDVELLFKRSDLVELIGLPELFEHCLVQLMVFLYVHVILFSYSPHILFFSFLPLSRLLLELSELIWFQAVYFSSVLALYLFQLLLHVHQLSVFLLDSCMLSLFAWSNFEVDWLKVFFELLDLMVFQSELAVQRADLSLKVDLLLSQLLLVFLHLSLWSFFVPTVASILQSLHHFLVHPLFAL